MNKFLFMGRMCGNLEMRTTSNDKKVGNFTVAVNRRFDRDKTDFVRCTAWEKTAENIEKFFGKGDMINIVGRVEIDPAEKDGVKFSYTNVIVEEFNFCGGKKETTATNDEGFVTVDDDEEPPF